MRMQLGKHPANAHGKLRAAMFGHGRLCSKSGEMFGLNIVGLPFQNPKDLANIRLLAPRHFASESPIKKQTPTYG